MSSLLKLYKFQPGLWNKLKYRHFHKSLCSRFSTSHYEGKSLENGLKKFKKGEVIQGFIVDEVSRVDEMYLTALRLTHLTTGAQYLHLSRDDSNNVFSIGFRTTPMDSTGLPHILEHTTLCGSERYPCRDPFFKMLRRSLATFMNAMTGPDYTIYPFSTQNLKDFQNLQSVYLDSVFKPNLREVDFRQEGWRLEHTDVNDKTSPIVFKGVVFNEMKGVFNENQVVFIEHLMNTILPSHTYSVISGGDPLVIPNLNHSDLVNFHALYYHPSNSRFYSYGNFPLEDHLKFINDRYLFLSERIDTQMSEVPPEKRWTEPKKKHITCGIDPMIADRERQGTIGIGFLCHDITDVQGTFEMGILSQLLLKGSNSPFYKSLVESNISTGFGPATGFDTHCKDTMFVLSLQGIKPDSFGTVEKVFDETVHNIIETGFEKDHIEAVMHNVELQVKHQTSDFGLHLLFNLTPLWNHNGNVIRAMKINKAVKNLREAMKQDPKYLQKLVAKYLKNNTHRLTLTMLPDENYAHEKEVQEQKLLRDKLDELSKEEIEKIYEEGQMLLAEQQKEEDEKTLPTLTVEDIKEDVDRYTFEDLKIFEVPLQLSIQPTNGVSYYRAILNTQGLSPDLKYVLPLFNNIVGKMGTENYDHRSFERLVQVTTGGLNFSNHISANKSNPNQYEEGILIESFCLDRNATGMWKLWLELFNNIKLDNLELFRTLVQTNATKLVSGIAHSGHMYAMSSAASLISPIAKFKEELSGLQYIGRMKGIAQLNDLTSLLAQMNEIAQYVFNKDHLRSAINLSEDHVEDTVKGMEAFYQSLKGTPNEPYIISSCEDTNKEETAIHHILPYTVNYTSKAILTVPYMHPDNATLRVLSKLITSIYLHPEIREKGGAYGSGTMMTPEGVFTMFSYRDPNSIRTLDLFDETYNFLLKHPIQQSDINEAKLGVFRSIDAPTPPSSRGMTKFLDNITDDEIQKQRERVKAVTKEQLMHVAEKYLGPDNKDIKVGRALIGPSNPNLIERHKENWTVLDQKEQNQAQAIK